MTNVAKPVGSLQISDCAAYPLWEYMNDDGVDETLVSPVNAISTDNLQGKLVSTQVYLKNGDRVWALLGNVDARNLRRTEHFLTPSLHKNGQWFTLARYHDLDYAERGPNALARFLALPVDEVFPISYDISGYVKGDSAIVSGQIPKEPREKLTRAEIIAMAVS
jgi:hypothetical protein